MFWLKKVSEYLKFKGQINIATVLLKFILFPHDPEKKPSEAKGQQNKRSHSKISLTDAKVSIINQTSWKGNNKRKE